MHSYLKLIEEQSEVSQEPELRKMLFTIIMSILGSSEIVILITYVIEYVLKFYFYIRVGQ